MFWDPAKHWIKKKSFHCMPKTKISKFEMFYKYCEKWIPENHFYNVEFFIVRIFFFWLNFDDALINKNIVILR